MSHENNVFDKFFDDGGNENIVTSWTKKMFVLHFNAYISKNRCSKIKNICFYYDKFLMLQPFDHVYALHIQYGNLIKLYMLQTQSIFALLMRFTLSLAL